MAPPVLKNTGTDKVYAALDECGRGCLAGDVYCAAVIWNPLLEDPRVGQIKDSKKLSATARRELAEFIKENAIDYCVAAVDVATIDRVNILNATMMGMHRALDGLDIAFDHILVDGNRFKPYHKVPHTCVVKGDDTYVAIAAASILAKVARDDYMAALGREEGMSVYGWDSNAGYGTPVHMDALYKHGPSRYHRMSFAPVASAIQRLELRNTI